MALGTERVRGAYRVVKTLYSVCHARKFRLRTDASRDTRGSRAFNMQLPRVIAKRAIHYGPVMNGRSFWQNQ